MLLRRIIVHARRQDWTAIGIDFVIVVIGVFFGLQVANWNQSLADARRGREHAAHLRADLERDLAGRRALTDYYAAVLDSVERTDALLADPDADPKALLVNAYRATEINFWPPSRTSWDEIVAAGDTGLLPREAIRNAGEYFATDLSADAWNTLSRSAYRHRVRRIVPLPLQKALRSGCSDNPDPDASGQALIRFSQDCRLDVEPAVIVATAQALRADPALAADLRQQYSDVYSAHTNLDSDRLLILRAIAALPAGASP